MRIMIRVYVFYTEIGPQFHLAPAISNTQELVKSLRRNSITNNIVHTRTDKENTMIAIPYINFLSLNKFTIIKKVPT